MAKLLFNPNQFPDLTFDDVFLSTNNDLLGQIREVCGETVMQQVVELNTAAEEALITSQQYRTEHGVYSKRLMKIAMDKGKRFMDYVLELTSRHPKLLKILSRDEVDFRPVPINIGGKTMRYGGTPVFISNMNSVAGERSLLAAARVGATVVLTQDKTQEEIRQIVEQAHAAHPVYREPPMVQQSTKIVGLDAILLGRDLDGKGVVVDEEGKFLGVIDLDSMPSDVTSGDTVSEYPMAHNPLTAQDGITAIQALREMKRGHVKFLPILDRNRRVIGALTPKAIGVSLRYHPNVDQVNGGLSVAAAVPAMRSDVSERVRFLIDAGVDCIVLDTAHLGQGLRSYKNIATTRQLVESSRRRILIVAGNVITAEDTAHSIYAGVDLVKGGIGPGAMCSTRIETAVGRPQISTILDCANVANALGKGLIADGGIREPRDFVLALAAGAKYVMWGSQFAGTLEGEGDLTVEDDGTMYRGHQGMASRKESKKRRYERAERSLQKIARALLGHREEGLSNARAYINPARPSIADNVHRAIDGLTSACTYVRAKNLREFFEKARIGIQMPSGMEEARPIERFAH